MSKAKTLTLLTLAIVLSLLASTVLAAPASSTAGPPGLPFTEDFSDTSLRDAQRTTANWSTEEQALVLAWRQRQFNAFGAGLAGADISADAQATQSVALGGRGRRRRP